MKVKKKKFCPHSKSFPRFLHCTSCMCFVRVWLWLVRRALAQSSMKVKIHLHKCIYPWMAAMTKIICNWKHKGGNFHSVTMCSSVKSWCQKEKRRKSWFSSLLSCKRFALTFFLIFLHTFLLAVEIKFCMPSSYDNYMQSVCGCLCLYY